MSSLLFRINSLRTLKFACSKSSLARSNLLATGWLSRGLSTSTKAQDEKGKVKKFTVEDENVILQRLRNCFDEEEKRGDVIPIFKKALLHGHQIAIKDEMGEYSYMQLYISAKKLSIQISNLCGSGSGARVAFLCSNNAVHSVIQWASWFSGQVVVPLSTKHPSELWKYYINDSKASLIITTPEYESMLKVVAENLDKILIVIDHSFIQDFDNQVSWLDPRYENVLQFNEQLVIEGALNSDFYTKSNAMVLYTSGTTGNPKGVVLTHKNINSQIKCLTDAWKFSKKDCLLHVLPLNHIHGCINALLCPLSVGAKIVMQNNFDSHSVWSALLSVNMPAKDRVNLFMAVPTIYSFLIDEYDKIFAKNSRMVEYILNHCKKNIRLMVSGSAPLPETMFNRWLEISGHRLLERYGMTEIGMALSNPYVEDKMRMRSPGSVGLPLPGVEVRIVDTNGNCLYECKGYSNKGFWCNAEQPVFENISKTQLTPVIGELLVKGPSVFKEYFNRPEETKAAFDGHYFKTGDIVSFMDGVFQILGRSSVDIIKTGGYKVSALQMETDLLTHPSIKDVTIVGVDDVTWGQKIAAVVVLRENMELDLESLKVFCSEKMASYSVPSILTIVNEIPRNAMGKVNKKEIINLFYKKREER